MSSSSVTLNTNSSSTSSIDQLVSEYITSISQPVYQLQSQESSINSLISTYNSIKSNLSSFQSQTTSLGAIGSLSPLAAKTTSSSDSSVVTATAQATATSGTHSLLITQSGEVRYTRVESGFTVWYRYFHCIWRRNFDFLRDNKWKDDKSQCERELGRL